MASGKSHPADRREGSKRKVIMCGPSNAEISMPDAPTAPTSKKAWFRARWKLGVLPWILCIASLGLKSPLMAPESILRGPTSVQEVPKLATVINPPILPRTKGARRAQTEFAIDATSMAAPLELACFWTSVSGISMCFLSGLSRLIP